MPADIIIAEHLQTTDYKRRTAGSGAAVRSRFVRQAFGPGPSEPKNVETVHRFIKVCTTGCSARLDHITSCICSCTRPEEQDDSCGCGSIVQSLRLSPSELQLGLQEWARFAVVAVDKPGVKNEESLVKIEDPVGLLMQGEIDGQLSLGL